METLSLVFLLLLAVGVSRILANAIPLPLPILQILMGSLIALPPFGMSVELDPEIFMMLFIPPLLFYDGWKISKREFVRHGGQIASMSVLLVLITIILVGYFIHWVLPSIPLAGAFALAAIVSPTDALAVVAIAKGKLPRNMTHQLEGEAMMNDATGLVAFKLAIAAAITGSFSVMQVTGEFLVVALGGLLIGAALSWGIGKTKQWMTSNKLFDPVTYVAMMLLLPFAAYFLADHAGMSGILAAVAAGMVQSRAEMMPVKSSTRIINRSVWEMLDFSFNGIVFLLLGLQFPRIVESVGVSSSADFPITILCLYAACIMVLLIAIRYAFVYGSLRLNDWLKAKQGKALDPTPYRLTSTLMSVAGVRGAITLAGVLSVPLMNGNAPFPGRDQMIFIAAAVIILSLAIGSLGVPFFLKRLPMKDTQDHELELNKARRVAAESAIQRLEQWQVLHSNDNAEEAVLRQEALNRVIDHYQSDLQAIADHDRIDSRAKQIRDLEVSLRLEAMTTQRKTLLKMKQRHEIDDSILQELIQELDHQESGLLPHR